MPRHKLPLIQLEPMDNTTKIPTFGIIGTRRPQSSSSMKSLLHEDTHSTCGDNLPEIHIDLAVVAQSNTGHIHSKTFGKLKGNSTELKTALQDQCPAMMPLSLKWTKQLALKQSTQS